MKNSNRTILNAEIDANLKKAYQDSLNQKLPKRFVDLIDQLRSKETPSPGSAPENGEER